MKSVPQFIKNNDGTVEVVPFVPSDMELQIKDVETKLTINASKMVDLQQERATLSKELERLKAVQEGASVV